jgi:hypothetical protein
MGYAPWAVRFKWYACGGHFVVIGALRLAVFAGIKQDCRRRRHLNRINASTHQRILAQPHQLWR